MRLLTWETLHPLATIAHLGLLPMMLNIDDPRPAREQFDSNYRHGGGWTPMAGFRLNLDTYSLSYPGDPPLKPIAKTKLRDETIMLYDHAWVVILQPDGSFEVARMD